MRGEQWPGENPLGQRLDDGDSKDIVVGVVGDAHINALSDDDAMEQYWPPSRTTCLRWWLVATASGDAAKPSADCEVHQ